MPPRSNRRSGPSGSTAATSRKRPARRGTILDQHGRTVGQDHRLGRPRRVQDRPARRVGAPVDGFGVGTELITSRDAPALAMVYKLVELDGEGKFKLSPGKRTYPMAKQVFRRRDENSKFCGDHVTQAEETAEGEPLLIPILRSGRLVAELALAREHPRSLPGSARRAAGQAARAGRPTRLSDHLQRGSRGPRAPADEVLRGLACEQTVLDGPEGMT